MVKIKRKRRLMPPLSLFCIDCLVGAAETAAPPLVCIDDFVGAAETAAPLMGVLLAWLVRWLFPTDFTL